MATEHGDAPAPCVRLDCEREQGAKRLKVDPASLVAQSGSVKEFGEAVALECVKQEPEEKQWQGCEAQWQPFLKVVETPSSEQRHSGPQEQAGCFQSSPDANQQLRGQKAPQVLFGSTKEPQHTTLAAGKTACKIVKDDFPGEVGREEEILGEDTYSWDAERQKFREFRYYEAVGPWLTSVRLGTLCRQWLQPKNRTKQQIMDQVILEQFLAILPREMQSWVKAHHPDSCPRAVALAEGFLLMQEQKVQGALQIEVAGVPRAEEPLLDSCQQPLSREIGQEDVSHPTTAVGGTVREIKEENLSQEHSLVEMPATTEGRAQGSISSPCESGLVAVPKEGPGTTCNPGGGNVRKIKEENLSEEDSFLEVPAPEEGRAQKSIAFPSGSALDGFPKEEPGTTCDPCVATVKEIKEETLSVEDSLMETHETAEGRAQQSIAFPSGSALVRFPKEELGTTCDPCAGTTREIKEETLSEEESLMEAPEMAEGKAQQSGAFPSESALGRLPKEEPGTACNPDSLSAHCEMPSVKSEEKPGKSGELEVQELVVGREEEIRGTPGQELAGEREEVWTGYGKTFRWKSVLTPCKEKVTGWKIYQCCACGKNCDGKSIRAHQKIHTGERLYECIYCGRTFSQRSHFEAHEKIHTGVKVQTRKNLYICVTCGKSFAYYSTLMVHKTSHGEDDASTAD